MNGKTATHTVTLVQPDELIVGMENMAGMCVDASAITLTQGSPTGGVYSGDGVANGIFNPTVAGVGTHVITYTYTHPVTGCVKSASTSVVVFPLPIVTFAPLNPVCVDASPVTLSQGFPVGGVYSGNGVSDNVFYPEMAGVGTHTLTYTFQDLNGCVNSTTQFIIVNPLPVVTFGSLGEICYNANPLLLSQGSPTGGTYSGDGVANGYFKPSAAGVGTHTLTYTYTDVNGCTNSSTSDIVVNPIPTAYAGADRIVFYGYTPMASATLHGTGTGGTGSYSYYWSTGATTQNITVSPTTTTTYTLTVTDAKGCSTQDQVTVTVNDVRCGTKGNPNKVLVCHNGHTICIDASAVPSHLQNHSDDYLGECGGVHKNGEEISGLGIDENTTTLTAYPNPFYSSTTISFSIEKDEQVSLDVFDAKGVRVTTLFSGIATSGVIYQQELQSGILAPGIYIGRLVTANEVKNIKLILVK
jgi:hypothetical protein